MRSINDARGVICFFGIGRSGNHVIIEQVYDVLPAPKFFFNNITADFTFEKRDLYYLDDQKYFYTKNRENLFLKRYQNPNDAKRNLHERRESYQNNGWIEETSFDLDSEYKSGIFSFEDLPLSKSFIFGRAV